jgi:hypothetical protein
MIAEMEMKIHVYIFSLGRKCLCYVWFVRWPLKVFKCSIYGTKCLDHFASVMSNLLLINCFILDLSPAFFPPLTPASLFHNLVGFKSKEKISFKTQ